MGCCPTTRPVRAQVGIGHIATCVGMIFTAGLLSCGPSSATIDEACIGIECAVGEVCVEGLCILDDNAPGCSTDLDCADGWRCEDGACLPPQENTDDCTDLICEPGFLCVGGSCIAEDELITCTTDTDCPVDSSCINSICQPSPAGALAIENPNVAFAALVVGDAYPLIAPAPSNLPDETVDALADDMNATTPPDNTGTTDTTTAQKPAPSTCTCTWRVEPDSAGIFDIPDSCQATLSSTSAGRFTLSVDVTCDAFFETFSQAAEAFDPPTPCEVDDDCASVEFCNENICVARTGPVARILSDRSRTPFVVEYSLRLEDRVGQPIFEGVTREQFRIFEDGIEIDYAETGYSIAPAPNLPLKLFLVLDYTQSMQAAGAIEAMSDAAKTFILGDQFTATHDIGLIEFHDRTDEGSGFGLVQALTSANDAGKTTLAGAVPSQGSLEAGASRVWDAVNLALSKLNAIERQPGEARAIVFLTDGIDTSSDTLPSAILDDAQTADILLYPIGFGDTTDNETLLMSLADSTGGRYLPASDAASLTNVFSDLADDLRGHWTLRYVTQKNTGTTTARIDFTHQGETTTFSSEVNVAALASDPNKMIVQVLEKQFDAALSRTNFELQAAYVPRNISQFRFFVAQSAPILTLPTKDGLTMPSAGWRLENIGSDTFALIGPAGLELGSYGTIGTISVAGNADQLQVTHDDSIYANLAQPKTTTFEGEVFIAPPRLAIVLSDPVGGRILRTPDRLAYEQGESVTLIAVSSGDYAFDKWEGAASGSDPSVTVTMDADKSVTATFFPPRTITVVVTPVGAGTVTLNPNKTTFRHGDIVELTATPISSTFASWSGGASGTSTTITVTMDGDKTVTATFTVSP